MKVERRKCPKCGASMEFINYKKPIDKKIGIPFWECPECGYLRPDIWDEDE